MTGRTWGHYRVLIKSIQVKLTPKIAFKFKLTPQKDPSKEVDVETCLTSLKTSPRLICYHLALSMVENRFFPEMIRFINRAILAVHT